MAISIGVLLLLCAVLVGLTAIQGPKLSGARVDTGRVVADTGQQLQMFANQPVAEVDAEQVTIAPHTPFQVTTQADVITVRFSQQLDHGIQYTVTVRGVTSPYQQREAELSYSFTTDAAAFHYLDRADPESERGEDAIIRTGVSGEGSDAIYRGARIQDYAVFEGALVVSTLAEDDTSSLALVSLVDGTTEPLELPGPGMVEGLAAAADGSSVLGFTMTSAPTASPPSYTDALFLVDLEGDRAVEPVHGLDGAPVEVGDWLFVPGEAAAVVRAVDNSLLRFDFTTGQAATPPVPTPLGSYLDLVSASSDGSRLVVADIFGPIALSIDGTEERLPASPLDGVVPSVGGIELLDAGSARVQQVAILDSSGRFASYLVHDGSAARILYQSPDGKGSIEGFRVSPNGQYVAVTVVPNVAASVSDGYYTSAMATSVSTIVLDVESGAVLASVDGFDVTW